MLSGKYALQDLSVGSLVHDSALNGTQNRAYLDGATWTEIPQLARQYVTCPLARLLARLRYRFLRPLRARTVYGTRSRIPCTKG